MHWQLAGGGGGGGGGLRGVEDVCLGGAGCTGRKHRAKRLTYRAWALAVGCTQAASMSLFPLSSFLEPLTDFYTNLFFRSAPTAVTSSTKGSAKKTNTFF